MNKIMFNVISPDTGAKIKSIFRDVQIVPSIGETIYLDWPEVSTGYIVTDVVHWVDDYPQRTVVLINEITYY